MVIIEQLTPRMACSLFIIICSYYCEIIHVYADTLYNTYLMYLSPENGTVAIMGSNRTATEGDQVTFQCLAAGWLPAAQVYWAVDGTPVVNVPYNTSSVANGTLMNSNSTLKITAKGNVSVDCLASISTLPSPEISTVFLTVRKRHYKAQAIQLFFFVFVLFLTVKYSNLQ